MAAKDLLGKPVEPYTHQPDGDGEKTSIALKIPKFGQVAPVLVDYQAYMLDLMRQVRGIIRDKKPADLDPDPDLELEPLKKSVYQIAVPLVRACLVEELSEDEVFELFVRMGIRLDVNLNHSLIERCLELSGQPRPGEG